ncbi:tetratricopeptide repeat protein [Salinisphaera sp. SPP-AMP-43]|uniref:tetratricopeptide repeat protein n=1 Tax=Salinisphaera sp. SPP-AMP-43 TaxID=3121288 RepID=UPI003C6E2319
MIQARYWIASAALLAVSAAAETPTTDAALQALGRGAPQQALSALQGHLAEHPEDPRARFVRAMALADSGRLDEAVAVFETLSSQYPQRARIWNNLGVLYARQGHLDKALDRLQQALMLAPDDADARENLGDVYVALARAAYRKAGQGADPRAALERKRRRLDDGLPALADRGAAASENVVSAAATDEAPGAPTQSTSPAAADQSRIQAQSNTGDDGVEQQIDQALAHWARARSDRDVSAYLASYSDDYQPAGDLSRAAWLRRQRARLQTPDTVSVRVDDIRIEHDSDSRARATFSAHYQSADSRRDAERHMVFVREDGAWRIVRES